MRISYDPEADAMYIFLNDGTEPELHHSDALGGEDSGVAADYNAAGELVGLEVLDAKQRFGASGASSIQLEILRAEQHGESSLASASGHPNRPSGASAS